MLESQFYMRLMLLFAVGLVYVFAYINMAKRNSKEDTPQRHIVLKIFGGFWALMSIIMGGAGVYIITQITFPQEPLGPFISPNMIVRSPDQTLYWGYATMAQSQCISLISGVFECFALSAYCFLYKSSHSKWYVKIGKVVFCILFYGFYVKSTDFHYFDLYEWTSPILYAVMAFFALKKNEKKECNAITDTVRKNVENKPSETLSENEHNSRYMPKQISQVFTKEIDEIETPSRFEKSEDSHVTLPDSLPEKVGKKLEIEETEICGKEEHTSVHFPEVSSTPTIKFCRHCGGRIDYASDKFCKHCGKQLY